MYKEFDVTVPEIADSQFPGSTAQELRVKNGYIFIAPLPDKSEMDFGVYAVIWNVNSTGIYRPNVYLRASFYSIKDAKIFAAVMSEII